MSAAAPQRTGATRQRRVWPWVVAAIGLLILGASIWIGARAILARDALLGAVPQVQQIRQDALAGNTAGITARIADVTQRANDAASLTSDPVWRAAELLPAVGVNLSSFRQAAAVIDQIAQDALPPVGDLASKLTLSSFLPKNGVLDTTAISSAAPDLAAAKTALVAAATSADSIPTSGTVPQIRDAVTQLKDLVAQTSTLVTGVADAAKILPGMLGADGPRDYLLLVQNNAESRSSGGIPGAMVVLHADHGAITLTAHASSADFKGRSSDIVPITTEEQALYSADFARYIQNVTSAPSFTRTGELARAWWADRFGASVDGVLSVDPVALSHVLKATGPLKLATGDMLSADNAVSLLLSEVYARYTNPAVQDAFFASVAQRVFEGVTSGAAKPAALVNALVQSGSERRLLVWSAHPDEQSVIQEGTLAGDIPSTSATQSGIGVYFNEESSSKMDYYLDSTIAAASAMCRADQRPYYEVRVRLTSTAPADAASTLPAYVLSGGGTGIPAGSMRPGVSVFFPSGSVVYGVEVDGATQPYVYQAGVDRTVAAYSKQLAPGQTTVLTFHALGPARASTLVVLDRTPMSSATTDSAANVLACPNIPTPAPGSNALGRVVAPVVTTRQRSDLVTNR